MRGLAVWGRWSGSSPLSVWAGFRPPGPWGCWRGRFFFCSALGCGGSPLGWVGLPVAFLLVRRCLAWWCRALRCRRGAPWPGCLAWPARGCLCSFLWRVVSARVRRLASLCSFPLWRFSLRGLAVRGSSGPGSFPLSVSGAVSPPSGPGGCAVGASSLSVRSVAFSAFRAGSLASVLLRPGRSGARLVLVCGFSSCARASAFARAWAVRVGGGVAVRRAPVGWSVSVPVCWRSSRLPGGCGRVVAWSGGLRGFVRALGSAGFVRVGG